MTKQIQQTAVEWIETLFYSESKQVGFDRWVILESDMDRIINKAKEMEKKQIINANRDGVDMVVDKKDFISGEQYYEQTYGGNK
jgi:hypothetical protein